MLDIVTWENQHFFGNALAAQYKLRYRIFVQRQAWDVPSYNGMEYDQFDTPAAVYLVRRGANGTASGVTRLIPTIRPYMIKELWPHLVAARDLPAAPDVWEATRFGVDQDLDPAMRRRVVSELICGCLEFGLLNGIKEYLGVMPVQIFRQVLQASGCEVKLIGPPARIGPLRIAAAAIPIRHDILDKVRRTRGITGPVLNTGGESGFAPALAA